MSGIGAGELLMLVVIGLALLSFATAVVYGTVLLLRRLARGGKI